MRVKLKYLAVAFGTAGRPFTLTLMLLLGASVCAQPADGIRGVVKAGVEPQLVRDGFILTEGPVGAADGSLYFSERGTPTRTYHLGLDGTITAIRENTNVANGLAYTPDGTMVLVEGGGKRVSRVDRDGTVTALTEGFDGKPFLEPNDLIVDAKGGIYFTDPGPRPLVAGRPTYVFYLPPGAKEPLVIDDQNPRPNGIILAPDGKTLYVDNTLGTTVDAFDVQRDGTVKNKRSFIQLRDIPEGQESGADGMAVDRNGRLYVTSITGVQVFSAKGEYLGTIKVAVQPMNLASKVPAQPVNLAFAGPDKRTLYVTARQKLFSIKMQVRGPKRLGK